MIDSGDRRRLGRQRTRRSATPSKIRWRLGDFYDATVDAAMPETTRLATTIQTWWPAIPVALTHDLSNPRTEGFNRVDLPRNRGGISYKE